jgi:hypothetical protein
MPNVKILKDENCLLGYAIPKSEMDSKTEEEIGEIFVKLMWSGLWRNKTSTGGLFLGLPIKFMINGNEKALAEDILKIVQSIGFDAKIEDIVWECNFNPE